MCALIGMAIYSTEENGKDEYLEKTLQSLRETVDFNKHRLQVSVNAATKTTNELLIEYSDIIEEVHRNKENIGTAEAINRVWKEKLLGEGCIKMDDDVTTKYVGWVDEMEEAIARESRIGQIGLKRKDCIESPSTQGWYSSELLMLPHKPGEKWIVVEQVNHVMGTCVMHSSALLDKIGYLYQPKLYGFDDAFASLRSTLAGFINVFLPHIEIEHIDTGATSYQKWKENHAAECWDEYRESVKDYKSGKKNIYYSPFKTNQ